VFCLDPGDYVIRWSNMGGVGQKVRLDCIDIYPVTTPVRPTTWGRIRTLFRN
jgi:hypothetical protein